MGEPGLFQVYLRLRPPPDDAIACSSDRFLTVEAPAPDDDGLSSPAAVAATTHVSLNPPNDRRRAVEKFAFTQVFEEDASQLDVFHCTNLLALVEGLLAPHGGRGTDALLATLGVTGSGKSHTILGSRSQRGMTQLVLDVLFRSIAHRISDDATSGPLQASIKSSDVSEASICTASDFLQAAYGDSYYAHLRSPSRSHPPQSVRDRPLPSVPAFPASRASCPGRPSLDEQSHPRLATTPQSVRMVATQDYTVSSPLTPEQLPFGAHVSTHAGPDPAAPRRPFLQAGADHAHPARPSPSKHKHYMSVTASARGRTSAKTPFPKGDQTVPPTTRRHLPPPSALPQMPDISNVTVPCDPAAEYLVLVSMYEVYNDRIFDLLTPAVQSAATKEFRRRALLFKPTEPSPDRKTVVGLRKVLCSSSAEALMVIEAGLHERRVAGTSTNSCSSRSHGFFHIEVKKRPKTNSKRQQHPWNGNAFTIVDLAGSERARDAKTAGATLAEAGKINESLMYLGQCLQMQIDIASNSKPNVMPFRQCKLTELLFSNSFPSASALSQSQCAPRNPQRAVMIVTADPNGDYNATSQILRYSALAREIAVPRVLPGAETTLQRRAASPPSPFQDTCANASPSLSPTPSLHRPPLLPSDKFIRSIQGQRNFSPVSAACSEDRVTVEYAAREIARLAEENSYLNVSLERERDARLTAEAHLLSMQDHILDLEQAVREDCATEFEKRLVDELARWKEARQTAIEQGEEHWDRKMEVFARSLTYEAPATEDMENVLIESLQEEGERLRREVTILKRELAGRSPSKRVPLLEREDFLSSTNGSPRSARPRQRSKIVYDETSRGDVLCRRLEDLALGSANSSRASSKGRADGTAIPGKKVMKWATRTWDGTLEGTDDPF